MKFDKSLLSGSTKLLVLSVLQDSDKYGYEMIESLAQRSDRAFEMKEGTLYPQLHSMENEGLIRAYDQAAPSGRQRRYYTLASVAGTTGVCSAWRYKRSSTGTYLSHCLP